MVEDLEKVLKVFKWLSREQKRGQLWHQELLTNGSDYPVEDWHYTWIAVAVLKVSKLPPELCSHICAKEKKAFCQIWGQGGYWMIRVKEESEKAGLKLNILKTT